MHDHLADGGYTKDEWPWKLLTDNQGLSDKWIVGNFTGNGWVKYKFKSPIMIRAYGLKSANDYPVRDPKNFSFWVLDVMEERKIMGDPFKEVHKAQN